jgi:hypothetical protein
MVNSFPFFHFRVRALKQRRKNISNSRNIKFDSESTRRHGDTETRRKNKKINILSASPCLRVPALNFHEKINNLGNALRVITFIANGLHERYCFYGNW